jgi:hypothetical protein
VSRDHRIGGLAVGHSLRDPPHQQPVIIRVGIEPFPAAVRDLRDLTRQRTRLVQQGVAVTNRIHKVLEDANIKLASVASNTLGKSGRAILGVR